MDRGVFTGTSAQVEDVRCRTASAQCRAYAHEAKLPVAGGIGWKVVRQSRCYLRTREGQRVLVHILLVACSLLLEFLPALLGAVLRLVICTGRVIQKLLNHSPAQIELHRSGEVSNADESVCKLHLDHLAVRELVVH